MATRYPPCAPSLTEDLASQLTDGTIEGEGTEGESANSRDCTYSLAESTQFVMAYVQAGQGGDTSHYEQDCVDQGNEVVEGVGNWGCIVGGPEEGNLNTLGTGNDKYEIGVSAYSGDLETYKSVASALLQKLPE